MKFTKSGRWSYAHQEGDTDGRWRIADGRVQIDSDRDEGRWTVKVMSKDYLIFSLKGSSTERYRRCKWS